MTGKQKQTLILPPGYLAVERVWHKRPRQFIRLPCGLWAKGGTNSWDVISEHFVQEKPFTVEWMMSAERKCVYMHQVLEELRPLGFDPDKGRCEIWQ